MAGERNVVRIFFFFNGFGLSLQHIGLDRSVEIDKQQLVCVLPVRSTILILADVGQLIFEQCDLENM